MNYMNRNNVVAGLLLVALGVFVVQQSLQWQILGSNGPGVGFFPLAYGALIVVLALVLTAKSLWAQREQTRQAKQKLTSDMQEPANVFAALTVWLAFAVSVALMKFIGFYISLGLLVMFMTRVIFSRGSRFVCLSGLLVPTVFFLVFGLSLKVQLPIGIWTGV